MRDEEFVVCPGSVSGGKLPLVEAVHTRTMYQCLSTVDKGEAEVPPEDFILAGKTRREVDWKAIQRGCCLT